MGSMTCGNPNMGQSQDHHVPGICKSPPPRWITCKSNRTHISTQCNWRIHSGYRGSCRESHWPSHQAAGCTHQSQSCESIHSPINCLSDKILACSSRIPHQKCMWQLCIYFPESAETQKGCMKMQLQNVQSTKVRTWTRTIMTLNWINSHTTQHIGKGDSCITQCTHTKLIVSQFNQATATSYWWWYLKIKTPSSKHITHCGSG